jgi:antitoxin component YwqK of YwqJK toxin-antitoxin module
MQNRHENRVPDSELDFDDDLIYRWRGELFTGVGFEESPDGALSEASYEYGVQQGPARDWYPSGDLKGESHFHDNVQHGVTREYSQEGSLLMESFYEYGILVEKRERGSSGEMSTTYVLAPDEETYRTLERYRRERGWPTSR